MTKKGGTLNAFLSESGKFFANVRGRNEGAQFPWRQFIMGGPNDCRGRRKAPKMSHVLSSTQ